MCFIFTLAMLYLTKKAARKKRFVNVIVHCLLMKNKTETVLFMFPNYVFTARLIYHFFRIFSNTRYVSVSSKSQIAAWGGNRNDLYVDSNENNNKSHHRANNCELETA